MDTQNITNVDKQGLNTSVALLGFSGLLPFIFLALAIFHQQHYATAWFCTYSAIIVAFLAGSQWHPEQTATPYLYHSNALALCAALALMLYPSYPAVTLILLIMSYLWLLLIEKRQGASGEYWTLRLRLSSTVLGLHLLVLVKLFN